MLRAAIYTRISKDDAKKGINVKTQELDLTQEAERRGAAVVAVLTDNDLSGSGAVERPDFNRLIEMIEHGDVDLVLAKDLDRLSRGFRPYVRFYEACEKARILVAWMGGQADFGKRQGLLELDIRASFAREELRQIQARTRRKHQQLAEDGLDAGGGRPFGYEADRHTIREDEAELIREAARRVLAGERLGTIARDWIKRGIKSPWAGKEIRRNGETMTLEGRWSPTVLRRLLCSARISGRREQVRVEGEKVKGLPKITNDKASWPAIITIGDSDRLRAYLNSPDRPRGEFHPRKYLLTGGLLRCGICGKPLHTSTPRNGHPHRAYACLSGPGFSGGCGKISISGERCDREVVDRVLGEIDDGALARIVRAHADDPTLADRLAAIDARLEEAGRELAISRGTVIALRSYTAQLEREREEVAAKLQSQHRRMSLDGIDAKTLRDKWDATPLERQRALIKAVTERIVVQPAIGRGPQFNPNRIEITWRF